MHAGHIVGARYLASSSLCLLLLTAAPALPQSSDSETLRSILQELRLLRQEIRDAQLFARKHDDLENQLQMQRELVKRALLRDDELLRTQDSIPRGVHINVQEGERLVPAGSGMAYYRNVKIAGEDVGYGKIRARVR